ncbi:MAG: MBL fold metallo-hydrolase, partial [Candidatus Bathyarchaeota archaeon]|nr:MBL fold metallo-hydrolase [Candidatus Bathyarchaeota archaeon]
ANYGEELKIEDCKIKLHNSGHILGSAAFQIDTPEGVIFYTGDLNYTDTIITLAASPVDCDILIIESTYGNGFIFPPREEIYKSMIKWVVKEIREGKIPVFYAYPIGKAQEIAKLFNTFLNVDVIVHPMIAKINKIYEVLGIKLKATPSYLSPKHQGCVAVYPFSMFKSNQIKNEASALITGWALNFKRKKGFPLSSHGDFKQILSFIMKCKPKKVYTCFGFTLQLAHHVKKKLGIDAEPLHT